MFKKFGINTARQEKQSLKLQMEEKFPSNGVCLHIELTYVKKHEDKQAFLGLLFSV